MTFVVFFNGLVLGGFALLMLFDALLFPETRDIFAFCGVLVGVASAFLCIASYSSKPPTFHRLHGFVLTASVWLTAALAGAIPLTTFGLTFVDAVFEAMSGITTTGSTVMTGLDGTPKGVIFWRALLQGLGGIGFIVTGIALLPMLRVGGMQLFRTESSDKGDKEVNSATRFAVLTMQVYGGLILICAALYWLGGMSIFDAITHAMTTLSTGGYSGYDASFGHFSSPFLQWTGTLFMLFGGLPFAWYIRCLQRGAFRSEQVEAMLVTLGIVIAVLTIWLFATTKISFADALRMVSFNVVSVVTTTGYAINDYQLWGPFAAGVFFFLTGVGGCTGSTAGGAKAMRWLIMGRAILVEMSRLRSPNRVMTLKYEGRRIDDDVINGVMSFMALYLFTFMVMTILLDMLGLDLVTASSGALTALANVGPGIGPIIGPAGNFATLNDPVKVVLTVGMYLGRLEMMTVFVLFLPLFWRELAD